MQDLFTVDYAHSPKSRYDANLKTYPLYYSKLLLDYTFGDS